MRSFHRLLCDDVLVLIAWLMNLATAITLQISVGRMYQSILVTSGRLSPPPSFLKDKERLLRGELALIVLFYSSLWAVKFSFLLFFPSARDEIAESGAFMVVHFRHHSCFILCLSGSRRLSLLRSSRSAIA